MSSKLHTPARALVRATGHPAVWGPIMAGLTLLGFGVEAFIRHHDGWAYGLFGAAALMGLIGVAVFILVLQQPEEQSTLMPTVGIEASGRSKVHAPRAKIGGMDKGIVSQDDAEVTADDARISRDPLSGSAASRIEHPGSFDDIVIHSVHTAVRIEGNDGRPLIMRKLSIGDVEKAIDAKDALLGLPDLHIANKSHDDAEAAQ
jgi:hypothetical protein